jgi:transcriptional regulator with XRE-family HTH domain
MELKGTSLASLLDTEIERQVDDDTSREDVIAQIARAAGISSSTVGQILRADINCPPLRRLEGFAEVLNVSMSRLRAAAESDGCEYSEESGKALHCRLMPSTKSVLDDINRLTESLKNS